MRVPEREPVTEGAIEEVADRDQLERAFRHLSLDQRTAVVLHHYLGLMVGQVADAVDAPVETVRSRLRYALRTMRAAIQADSRLPGTPADTPRDTRPLPEGATSGRGTTQANAPTIYLGDARPVVEGNTISGAGASGISVGPGPISLGVPNGQTTLTICNRVHTLECTAPSRSARAVCR